MFKVISYAGYVYIRMQSVVFVVIAKDTNTHTGLFAVRKFLYFIMSSIFPCMKLQPEDEGRGTGDGGKWVGMLAYHLLGEQLGISRKWHE